MNNLTSIKYSLYALAFFGTNLLMAGGIREEGISMLKVIRYTAIGIIAVVCTILFTFEGVQGYSGHKTWGEVGNKALWIFFIGAASAIAAWIFTAGQKVTM